MTVVSGTFSQAQSLKLGGVIGQPNDAVSAENIVLRKKMQ